MYALKSSTKPLPIGSFYIIHKKTYMVKSKNFGHLWPNLGLFWLYIGVFTPYRSWLKFLKYEAFVDIKELYKTPA